MNQSVRAQFDVLKELVVVDEDIRKLDADLVKERETLEGTKLELERVREQIEVERHRYDDIEADRGARMQEARVLNAQLERSRDKLNRARNEKELQAVQRELEETRKLLRDVEDAVGKRALELEELKKSIIDHEEQEAGMVARIGETEGAVSAKLAEIQGVRDARATEREAIAKKLPTPTLRKYDQIRTRRNPAAARLEGGRCKACNMAIPPQLAQRIARVDVLEQCPSCNRFLFVESAAPSAPPNDPPGTAGTP